MRHTSAGGGDAGGGSGAPKRLCPLAAAELRLLTARLLYEDAIEVKFTGLAQSLRPGPARQQFG